VIPADLRLDIISAVASVEARLDAASPCAKPASRRKSPRDIPSGKVASASAIACLAAVLAAVPTLEIVDPAIPSAIADPAVPAPNMPSASPPAIASGGISAEPRPIAPTIFSGGMIPHKVCDPFRLSAFRSGQLIEEIDEWRR
jgi:hypothetical protein